MPPARNRVCGGTYNHKINIGALKDQLAKERPMNILAQFSGMELSVKLFKTLRKRLETMHTSSKRKVVFNQG